MRIKLPLEISDGRVDGILKILSTIRKISPPLLTLEMSKKTVITPAGWAILQHIGAIAKEHNVSLRWNRNLIPPASIILKNLNAGLWPQLPKEIEEKFTRFSEDTKFKIKLILNELMQNAIDHSGSEEYTLYAGTMNDEIHLGCLDWGITIPSKLEQKYIQENDLEYIKHSLIEGVSTRRMRTGGLGLTHVFDLAKLNQGRLVIVSKGAQYRKYFQTRKSQKNLMKYSLHGTWVMVRFSNE